MARLLHHFLPLFSFGLSLDAQVEGQRASEPGATVTTRASELIARARAAALADGKRPEQVDDSIFAIVAWIDEIMARNPAWLTGSVPLQVSLFTTNNAGNEFFAHLSALKQEQDEVREVYYHALLAGFLGQYYYENADTGELGKLKELHGRQLPIAPAPTHTLREERITPQPYSIEDPAGPRFPRQWDRTVLRIGAVVAVLAPLAYLAWLLIAAPKPSAGSIQTLVDQQLGAFPCSELLAEVDDKGITKVRGYVSRPDDVAAVKQKVSAVEGVREPTYDLQLRIWPHCEVVQILAAYTARNTDAGYGLKVMPTSGHSDRFIDGEKVIVNLQQANYDGYVYVDYYSVDGGVAHIWPNAREHDSGRLITRGEQVVVGDTPEGWVVGPPFGQELITVIASPTPLYPEPLTEIETAEEYLPKLRQMLDANRSNAKLAATYLFMQTEPAR
ncbi:MAG: DotU family type IV/VI secretion system protein [Pseudomonadota bacterium]|nr:DotU family type IV/VI secretion system protein [Pseudomonadota bacterium]